MSWPEENSDGGWPDAAGGWPNVTGGWPDVVGGASTTPTVTTYLVYALPYPVLVTIG